MGSALILGNQLPAAVLLSTFGCGNLNAHHLSTMPFPAALPCSPVEAKATVDNSDCLPDDLNCMKATIGTADEPSDAAVEAVAVWDGHVSCWVGRFDCGMRV